MPSISLTTVALATSLAGAAASAYGAVEAGQAQSSAASYRAQVANNNKQIAEQNAQYALQAGSEKATNQSLKGAAQSGKIKAVQAAGNVDVNSGSAVKVQEGQRETNELDTETVMNNAQLQAYGYRSQAAGDAAQAGLDEAESSQAKTGADIGAAGSLFSDASSTAFKWKTAT